MKLRILILTVTLSFLSQNCTSQNKPSFSRNYIINLTNTLCKDNMHPDTLANMQEMIWLAYSSPAKFDSKYKNVLHRHFGSVVDTVVNGTKYIIQSGAMSSWLSYNDDDTLFLMSLLDQFLSDYEFISYGDDLSGIEGAFHNLCLTKDIKLPAISQNDNWVSYLNKISNYLKTLNLCVLREIDGFSLIVCRCDKSESIINQMKIINWNFKL